jgi:hypothetical protein
MTRRTAEPSYLRPEAPLDDRAVEVTDTLSLDDRRASDVIPGDEPANLDLQPAFAQGGKQPTLLLATVDDYQSLHLPQCQSVAAVRLVAVPARS